MLHGALRFSDHPRAVVKKIDLSRALAMPSVIGVLLGKDGPGLPAPRGRPTVPRPSRGACSSPCLAPAPARAAPARAPPLGAAPGVGLPGDVLGQDDADDARH